MKGSHGGGAAEAGLKLPGTNSLALARSAVVLRSMAAACALLRLLGNCLFWLGGRLATGCGKPCHQSFKSGHTLIQGYQQTFMLCLGNSLPSTHSTCHDVQPANTKVADSLKQGGLHDMSDSRHGSELSANLRAGQDRRLPRRNGLPWACSSHVPVLHAIVHHV